MMGPRAGLMGGPETPPRRRRKQMRISRPDERGAPSQSLKMQRKSKDGPLSSHLLSCQLPHALRSPAAELTPGQTRAGGG